MDDMFFFRKWDEEDEEDENQEENGGNLGEKKGEEPPKKKMKKVITDAEHRPPPRPPLIAPPTTHRFPVGQEQPKLSADARTLASHYRADMAGAQFSCAGPLVTFENNDNSFYLSHASLKKIIINHGGRYVDNVTAKTSVFILGAVERIDPKKHNKGDKKGQAIPTWVGTSKHAAVEKQLAVKGKVGKRQGPPQALIPRSSTLRLHLLKEKMRQLTFKEFMEHYDIEEECFLVSEYCSVYTAFNAFTDAHHPTSYLAELQHLPLC